MQQEEILKPDGIHRPVPYENMTPGAKKMRDFYAIKPGAGIYQKEFGFYTLDTWQEQGYIKRMRIYRRCSALTLREPIQSGTSAGARPRSSRFSPKSSLRTGASMRLFRILPVGTSSILKTGETALCRNTWITRLRTWPPGKKNANGA